MPALRHCDDECYACVAPRVAHLLTARFEPVPNASITTSPPTNALVIDSEGRFTLEDIETGGYTITATRTNSDTAAVDSALVRVEYRARNPSDARVSHYQGCFRIPTEGNTFYHEEEGDSLATGQVDVGRFKRYTSDEQVPDACRGTASFRRGLNNAAEERRCSGQRAAGHKRLMLR